MAGLVSGRSVSIFNTGALGLFAGDGAGGAPGGGQGAGQTVRGDRLPGDPAHQVRPVPAGPGSHDRANHQGPEFHPADLLRGDGGPQ